MICSIGVFVFAANEVTNMSKNINANFTEYNPIGDNPHYHSTNGYKEEITIAGVYIASSNSKASILEGLVRSKKTVRFTMATGESMRVIVTDFSSEKKNFLPFSGAVNIDFTIKIRRAGGSFGVLSIIGAILALF